LGLFRRALPAGSPVHRPPPRTAAASLAERIRVNLESAVGFLVGPAPGTVRGGPAAIAGRSAANGPAGSLFHYQRKRESALRLGSPGNAQSLIRPTGPLRLSQRRKGNRPDHQKPALPKLQSVASEADQATPGFTTAPTPGRTPAPADQLSMQLKSGRAATASDPIGIGQAATGTPIARAARGQPGRELNAEPSPGSP